MGNILSKVGDERLRMYDIIEKKRDGHPLEKQEIDYVINGFTRGQIPDYQMSALLMAIYFQGMTDVECANLTMAMAQSGETLDLTSIEGIKVDKHSTGGVGDTTSITLIPLVASMGVPIPKMSGRGLGHTGGTIDKLESIEGFHVELKNDHFMKLVKENGLAMIGQSENLAPADKLLYSLRDVTATVNSIPLIASSIMSKKIASGADKIVLDVKVGYGAFMKNIDEARQLAETMVQIGNKVGKETIALITNMDEPLGNAIGNALEIKEAISTLRGEGPKDLTELTLQLGAQMVVLGEKETDIQLARKKLQANIDNGLAIDYFKTFVGAQGGNSAIIDDVEQLPNAAYKIDVKAREKGVLTEIVAHELGRAAMLLGAGRKTKDDTIDLAVGIYLHKKVGDPINVGDILCTLHTMDKDIQPVIDLVYENMIIGETYVKKPLIIDVIR